MDISFSFSPLTNVNIRPAFLFHLFALFLPNNARKLLVFAYENDRHFRNYHSYMHHRPFRSPNCFLTGCGNRMWMGELNKLNSLHHNGTCVTILLFKRNSTEAHGDPRGRDSLCGKLNI